MSYVTHYAGKRDQRWTTPRDFFLLLDARFNFTLDGAADAETALLPNWRGSESMFVSWRGERVFCNPPWKRIAEFVEFAPEADLAVLLVPARVNAKWFHRALALGARPEYFAGRLRFGGASSNSPVDCLLLLFGAAVSLGEQEQQQ